jgi:hypothetical protein
MIIDREGKATGSDMRKRWQSCFESIIVGEVRSIGLFGAKNC